MAHNVLTWKEALNEGMQPADFTFVAERIPQGDITAMLCFKIWAQKLLAINCYFRDVNSGNGFVVTVLCSKAGYIVGNRSVNFATCATLRKYRLHILTNRKGKIELAGATALSSQ